MRSLAAGLPQTRGQPALLAALLFVALLLAARPVMAQRDAIPKAVLDRAARINGTQILRDIEYIASDALGGRETFSAGLDSAIEFVVRRLQRAGLTPLGDNGTFLQHYSVREFTADTAALLLTVNAEQFRFGDILLASFGRQTSITAPVVYVGHGWRIPSLNIDPYANVDVRGKIVLFQGGVSPGGLEPGDMPADAEHPRIVTTRLGAVASLVLPSTRAFWDYLRSESPSSQDLEETTTSAYGPRATVVLIKPAVAAALLANDSMRAARVMNGEVAPSVQLPAQVTLTLPSAQRRRTAHNVVAMIPGRDSRLTSEFVTFGAHLDAGSGPIVDGDSIYNGADDNASGSAAILAIAEQLARAPRPRRSIAFIWTTGHEDGIWGSRSFVASAALPMDRIVAHLNLDMVGSSRVVGVDSGSTVAELGEVYVIGPRAMSTQLDSVVERTNRRYLNLRLNHRFDTPTSEFVFPRTDAGPLVERGVPVITLFTGEHARYHRPQDEVRFLDPTQIEMISRTAFVIGWTLAEQVRRPRLNKQWARPGIH